MTVSDICNDPRFTHFNATKSLLSPPLVSGLKGFCFFKCSADEGREQSKVEKKSAKLPAHKSGFPPDENWSVSLIYSTGAGVTVHMELFHVSLAEHHLLQLLQMHPTQTLC